MLMTSTYEQTLTYNPNDPSQVIREAWAPGGYTTYYYNRVPDAGALKGLGLSFTGLPQWAQVGLVFAASAVVGYVGYAKYGDKYVKPQLRRFGLAGGRRRR